MTLETFFEKFDQLVNAPNAVAKMRELILQLAAHGKLVEQSRDDESATALVARIEKHFEALRSRKELRGLPVKSLDREELPEIPLNWEWVRLGNVVDYGSSDKTESADIPEDAWLLDLEDIEKDTSRLLQRKSFRDSPSKSTKTEFEVGDVLYGKLRPYLNKVIVADVPGYCTTEIVPIRAFGFIEPAYLCYALKRPEFTSYANSKSYGMNLPRLGTEDARSAPFPLPPLVEQKRIVAKVDELMALCDRLEAQQQERETRHAALARASLARFADAATPTNLNFLFHPSYTIPPSDLRKSILTLAVQGKLVPQDPNDEPAGNDFGRNEELSADAPFEIPEQWTWTQLCQLADINGGFAFKSTDYSDIGTRVVRISDFDEFGFKDHKIVRHRFSPELQKFTLSEGNILMAMTGGTVGKSYYVRSLPEPMVVNQRVATIKVSSGANPSYIDILIRSEMTQEVIREAKNSTNDNISMVDIKGFAVPIPPLAEQRQIVAKVEQLMALVDELETQLAASRATAEKIMEAVVAELTTQD